MSKNAEELLGWLIGSVLASGLVCTYFLRPDNFPHDISLVDSVIEGIKKPLTWLSILAYGLSTGLPSFVLAVFALSSKLNESGPSPVIFLGATVTTAIAGVVIWVSTPVGLLTELDGIWGVEEKNHQIMVLGLTNQPPLLAFANSESEIPAMPVKVENVDHKAGAVTVSVSNPKINNSTAVLTLSLKSEDGAKKLVLTSSLGKPEKMKFVRPLLKIDKNNIVPIQTILERDPTLIKNCKIATHNKRPDLVFHDEVPLPVADTTVSGEVFKSSPGYAALIYVGVPPRDGRFFGESFSVRCNFSQDFKLISLSTCDKLPFQCMD